MATNGHLAIPVYFLSEEDPNIMTSIMRRIQEISEASSFFGILFSEPTKNTSNGKNSNKLSKRWNLKTLRRQRKTKKQTNMNI